MSIKKEIIKGFSDSLQLKELRFRGANFSLIIFAYLFFVNYFLVSYNFYLEIFLVSLPYTYFAFITSLIIFFYTYLAKYMKSRLLQWFYMFILLIIFVFLLIPFFVPELNFHFINVDLWFAGDYIQKMKSYIN